MRLQARTEDPEDPGSKNVADSLNVAPLFHEDGLTASGWRAELCHLHDFVY
jgi:hypothetical protein